MSVRIRRVVCPVTLVAAEQPAGVALPLAVVPPSPEGEAPALPRAAAPVAVAMSVDLPGAPPPERPPGPPPALPAGLTPREARLAGPIGIQPIVPLGGGIAEPASLGRAGLWGRDVSGLWGAMRPAGSAESITGDRPILFHRDDFAIGRLDRRGLEDRVGLIGGATTKAPKGKSMWPLRPTLGGRAGPAPLAGTVAAQAGGPRPIAGGSPAGGPGLLAPPRAPAPSVALRPPPTLSPGQQPARATARGPATAPWSMAEPLAIAPESGSEGEVQTKPASRPAGLPAFAALQPAAVRAMGRAGSPGARLSEEQLAPLAPVVGGGLKDVRIHTGESAAKTAAALGAEAFTVGRDIFFAEGKFDPHSLGGRALLAHELTHVRQQTGTGAGRVSGYGGAGAGEAEAEAAEQEVLAGGQLGGAGLTVGRYVRNYASSDGRPLSSGDQARLDAISFKALAVCRQLLGPELEGAASETLKRLSVEVSLDLAALSDEQAAEVWGRALAEGIRAATGGVHDVPAVPELVEIQRSPVTSPRRRLTSEEAAQLGYRIVLPFGVERAIVGTEMTLVVTLPRHGTYERALPPAGAGRAGPSYPYAVRWWVQRPGGRGFENINRSGPWSTSLHLSSPPLTLKHPGKYRVVALTALGPNRAAELVYDFEAVAGSRVAAEAFAKTSAKGYLEFRAAVAAKELELSQYGVQDQRFDSKHSYITCSGPNPTQPGQAPYLTYHTYTIHPDPAATRFRWYVLPADKSDMADNYHGFPRIKVNGEDAYSLNSSGVSAKWIIAKPDVYAIICEQFDRQGKPLKAARYVQVVQSRAQAQQLASYREYSGLAEKHLAKIKKDAKGKTMAVPIRAVHLDKETGQTAALALFVGPDATDPSVVRLLDLTPDVPRREYDAYSKHSGWATLKSLDAFDSGNKYPAGLIQLDIPENQSGILPTKKEIKTTGRSTAGAVSSGFGWASLGLTALGFLALASGVGAVAAPYFFIAAAGTGVAGQSLSLYDQLKDEKQRPTAIMLDIAGIAASLVGGAGGVKALQAARAGRLATVANTSGRFLLYAGFTTDVVEGVLLGVDAGDQILTILSSGMPDDKKIDAVVRILAYAALNGGLKAYGAQDLKQAQAPVTSGAKAASQVPGPAAPAVKAVPKVEGPAVPQTKPAPKGATPQGTPPKPVPTEVPPPKAGPSESAPGAAGPPVKTPAASAAGTTEVAPTKAAAAYRKTPIDKLRSEAATDPGAKAELVRRYAKRNTEELERLAKGDAVAKEVLDLRLARAAAKGKKHTVGDAPTAGAARETFQRVYDDLLNDPSKRWKPKGPLRAIAPDPSRYPTLEIRPNGDVIGSYSDVLKYARDAKLTGTRSKTVTSLEAHHLLEDRLMTRFGITKKEGICVALEASDHAYFSAEVPKHMRKGAFYDVDDVFRASSEVYIQAGHPEWLDTMRAFLRQNADRIKNAYNGTKIPVSGRADFAARRQRVFKFLEGL